MSLFGKDHAESVQTVRLGNLVHNSEREFWFECDDPCLRDPSYKERDFGTLLEKFDNSYVVRVFVKATIDNRTFIGRFDAAGVDLSLDELPHLKNRVENALVDGNRAELTLVAEALAARAWDESNRGDPSH